MSSLSFDCLTASEMITDMLEKGQVDFCDIAKGVGVSHQTLDKWYKCQSKPSKENRVKLEEFYLAKAKEFEKKIRDSKRCWIVRLFKKLFGK